MLITPTPVRPWQVIEAELFTWDGAKYLTVVDRFSRVAAARAVRDKGAVRVIEALQEVLSTYGCPEVVITDNGRELVN